MFFLSYGSIIVLFFSFHDTSAKLSFRGASTPFRACSHTHILTLLWLDEYPDFLFLMGGSLTLIKIRHHNIVYYIYIYTYNILYIHILYIHMLSMCVYIYIYVDAIYIYILYVYTIDTYVFTHYICISLGIAGWAPPCSAWPKPNGDF